MICRALFAGFFTLTILVMLSVPNTLAQSFRVEPATWPFIEDGNAVDSTLEASAVLPVGTGDYLLVADDRTKGLVIVETRSGRQVGRIKNSQFPFWEPGTGEPFVKWEALARDEKFYFVLASHSGGKKYYQANSFLVRFSLVSNEDGIPTDVANATRWRIDHALKQERLYPPDDSGDRVKLEGLAVWVTQEGKRMLAIGLREARTAGKPIRVYVSDITNQPHGDSQLHLTKLLSFDGGETENGVTFKLSSLEHATQLHGLLVLTASENDDNEFIENVLWLVPDSNRTQPMELWRFGRGLKAEGLCVLPRNAADEGIGTARIAIVFDNDPNKTKRPSRYQIATILGSKLE